MRRIWQTLRLGVVTTCLGYLVLAASSFEGLKQLGVFTLVGLLTAALTSRYLLPSLYKDDFDSPRLRGERVISRLVQQSRRLPVAVTLIALLIVTAAVLSPRPLWNDDIAVLSPLPSSMIAQDRSLRQELQADEASQMILLEAESIEQLLQQCESLRPYIGKAIEKAWLNSASLLCDVLPSQQRQRETQSQLPEPADLAIALETALSDLPFKQQAFAPFIQEIAASRQLTPLSYEKAIATPLGDRLAPYIKQTADGWVGLVPLQFVLDNDALAEQFQDLMHGVSYLNLRSETSGLIEDFRTTALLHLLLGACLMFLILWLGLRDLSRTLLVMLPIALAIAVTVSLLKLIGEEMNLFHLISLMLVLGIGIDYSLFFSRENEELSERKATLHALGLCALSTASVFTILATSRIPVLHAIGTTVSIGVASSFLLTYALAPSQGRAHVVIPS
jgi:predicted exporter